ncbi:MAG: hypothetical protein ACYDDC_05855 [Thermoplasmataceae archaeon]
MKRCPCCGVQLAREDWLALPLVGVQQQAFESSSELRNCRCGSTIALPRCYTCDEAIAEGTGTDCDCGAIACCADCGPARHAGEEPCGSDAPQCRATRARPGSGTIRCYLDAGHAGRHIGVWRSGGERFSWATGEKGVRRAGGGSCG